MLCQKTLENRTILKRRNADTIVCSQTLCFPYSGSVLEALLLHFSDLGRSWGPFWEGWKSFWRNLGSPGAPFEELWGPYVPRGAVLGARRWAEAFLEAKSWFVGPPLSQNGTKNRLKVVATS